MNEILGKTIGVIFGGIVIIGILFINYYPINEVCSKNSYGNMICRDVTVLDYIAGRAY